MPVAYVREEESRDYNNLNIVTSSLSRESLCLTDTIMAIKHYYSRCSNHTCEKNILYSIRQ